MCPTIYLDQDALINLYEESERTPAFEEKLNSGIAERRFTIALSPWHWVETARTTSLAKAVPLAEFMDWLRPTWLRDRRHLARTEVEERFFQFAKIPYTPRKAMVSRAELLTEMNGFRVSPERAPSSREFVEAWIKEPKLVRPIVESYQRNVRALLGLREALANGKVTPEIMREGDRKHIDRHLPTSTPNGIVLDAGTKSAFLDSCSPTDFPVLAIEAEIAEYSWANRGRTDWNSLIDKFHLIASTPHSDTVVSDDRFFYLLLPCALKTGHVTAQVMKFQRFCASYLP